MCYVCFSGFLCFLCFFVFFFVFLAGSLAFCRFCGFPPFWWFSAVIGKGGLHDGLWVFFLNDFINTPCSLALWPNG